MSELEFLKMGWRFDNTYVNLPKIMLTRLNPVPVKSPKLVIINRKLSEDLGLDFTNVGKEKLALIFSGNSLPKGSESISQAYAGHQFGYFTMLGDGRAHVIGEHITKDNKRFDIQFKGSGKTPYSRNADGRAALAPMLREYIISEAMNGLNIPTTRSLAVVSTGEKVIRETMLPGAILTRVASSHIRVGTFQYLAMCKDIESLRTLVGYTINRHYPKLKSEKNLALSLLKIVIEKQIKLVTNWMRVGFIHGVMNTDNMSICGETIDYGPCAFMDEYNPETVFSSIDQSGRYAFFNQPGITKWNLLRFAETLIPLIDQKEESAIKIAEEAINDFGNIYKKYWIEMMKKKLGLFDEDKDDEKLIEDLLEWMKLNEADYTNTFCQLTNDRISMIEPYNKSSFINWHKRWLVRLNKNNKPQNFALSLMKNNNPLIIPRNYKIEEVLDAATNDDLNPFENMLKILKKPYEYQEEVANYQSFKKDHSKTYKTFCGT